jgi:DNA-binding response OmpR family regulator
MHPCRLWSLKGKGSPVRLLLVEDYKPLARALKHGLTEAGFEVDVAHDGAAARHKAASALHDVIVLHLVLPKEDGFSLLAGWRRAGLQAPVLVLTGREELPDKVRALDLGADDYLTKPFRVEELLARLRALARRERAGNDTVLRAYDLEINTAARSVRRAGRRIPLTAREYALLEFLALRRGRVVSRSVILEHLYDGQGGSRSNVVDVYIRYLRNKIDKGFEPPLILTRWGEGYLLRGDDE